MLTVPSSSGTVRGDSGRHSGRRLLAFWSILILLMLLALEGAAAVVVHQLLKSRSRYLLWDPDFNVVRASWTNSAAKVDEELGWPSLEAATSGTRDKSGAKVNDDFRVGSEACLSAYGDSFVWGDEVPLRDGWIEQLGRLLGCRPANYGVSGYGTDQAYLRFRRMTHDNSPLIILGIFPDNIVRNVNQYRAFIGFGLEPFWIKGRFILDGAGELKWIPRPKLDLRSYVELHHEPRALLPREYLLPDTRDGPVTVSFPYALTLMRFVMVPRIWTRLRGQTPWTDFYSPDHASGAVKLTTAIARAFVQEAERRGARVFIIMMPSAGSFRSLERFGAPDYAPFVAAMVNEGVDVFDPLPALALANRNQSYCRLYAQETACEGHFGVFGGTLLANVVAAELRRRALVQSDHNPN